MTSWTEDQPVTRPLPTHRTTQTQNKRTQTFIPRVGFEPTIPVFNWEKKVHALVCAVTVSGEILRCWIDIICPSEIFVNNLLFVTLPGSSKLHVDLSYLIQTLQVRVEQKVRQSRSLFLGWLKNLLPFF
jgi:hypothetical protein